MTAYQDANGKITWSAPPSLTYAEWLDDVTPRPGDIVCACGQYRVRAAGEWCGYCEVGYQVSIFDDPTCYPGKVLDQPYAGAVRLAAEGYAAKNIETRRTRILRVPCDIVIIAGHAYQYEAAPSVQRALRDAGIPQADIDRANGYRGVAVAMARVTECRPLTAADEPASLWWDAEANAKEPRWAWCLADMRPLRPFAVRGVPGFVRVPRAKVDAALVGSIRSA